MSYEGSLPEFERQYHDWLASEKPLLEAHEYPAASKTYPFVITSCCGPEREDRGHAPGLGELACGAAV
jgi:hypothetical protein